MLDPQDEESKGVRGRKGKPKRGLTRQATSAQLGEAQPQEDPPRNEAQNESFAFFSAKEGGANAGEKGGASAASSSELRALKDEVADLRALMQSQMAEMRDLILQGRAQ